MGSEGEGEVCLMRGDLNLQGMRGGTRKKEEGLAESGRALTSRSDPIGLSQAEGAPRLRKRGQLRLRHDAMDTDAK
jgi:hypothetical protein